MPNPEPEVVREALARHPWVERPALPGRRNDRRAGVIVPLVWEEGLFTWLTLRPEGLRRHGGEVCFPGGRPEVGDADLEATARREAREELGLRDLEVWGRLSSMPLYTSEFRLEPFVARVPAGTVVRPCPEEVAEVVRVDVGSIVDQGTVEAVAIPFEGGVYSMPVFRAEGWLIYGATALTLYELIEVVAQAGGTRAPEKVVGNLDFREIMARGAATTRRAPRSGRSR